MLPAHLLRQIRETDRRYKTIGVQNFRPPKYNPRTYYLELTRNAYFNALIGLRHYIRAASDHYFGSEQKAMGVDLFMLTSSVSSPTGPGSDSVAIPIKFGKYKTNLVDSSQFGFEPLLLNGIDKVYCYLPSMRGERPDKRHLNQFFHCEAEIRGTLEKLIPMVEGYIRILAATFLEMPLVLKKISFDPKRSEEGLKKVLNAKNFSSITFDEAVDLLIADGGKRFVSFTKLGRSFAPGGELRLAKILNTKAPFWIKYYDRDRVAFYQKPCPTNKNKTINADLIFPPLTERSFGGEIVGCGQRQDNPGEIIESLNRQKLNRSPYEWYIDLRKLPAYRMTSGFGLGIERFIAWGLCHDDIKDGILYPRLKNVKTYP